MAILRSEVDLGKKHTRKLKINQCLFSMQSSPSLLESESSSGFASFSEEEKVRRLLDDEFVQQMAEHIARCLEPRWRDGRSGENTGEIMRSLESMHAKTDKMVGMITDLSSSFGLLSERVSSLEGSCAELREENSRLRKELRRTSEGGETRDVVDDLLFEFGRVSCEKLLKK